MERSKWMSEAGYASGLAAESRRGSNGRDVRIAPTGWNRLWLGCLGLAVVVTLLFLLGCLGWLLQPVVPTPATAWWYPFAMYIWSGFTFLVYLVGGIAVLVVLALALLEIWKALICLGGLIARKRLR